MQSSISKLSLSKLCKGTQVDTGLQANGELPAKTIAIIARIQIKANEAGRESSRIIQVLPLWQNPAQDSGHKNDTGRALERAALAQQIPTRPA